MSVLACDLGGTRIKLGIVEQGRLLATDILPAYSDQGLEPALPRLEAAFQKLAEQVGLRVSDCEGIGIGFPALVNSREGTVLNHYNKYADAPHLDLRAWARTAWGLSLAIDNDARLALLGEWTCGAGRGSNNLAIVTLGTGIGTAVILEGRLLRGPSFRAGNLGGHLIANLGGRACSCGAFGCVEAETATAYLADTAKSFEGFEKSLLSKQEEISYETVCRGASLGDSLAVALLRRATAHWGALCLDLANLFDLDRIVLGGGVMKSADAILPLIRGFVRHNSKPTATPLEIVAAQHPDEMALLGCEALVAELKAGQTA